MPGRMIGSGWHPGPSEVKPARSPSRSYLAKGRGSRFRGERKTRERLIASELARFSTLEGYASRDLRNGVGSAMADDQPPSWFSSGVGTKADAKQQLGLPCANAAERGAARESSPKACARLESGLGSRALR